MNEVWNTEFKFSSITFVIDGCNSGEMIEPAN